MILLAELIDERLMSGGSVLEEFFFVRRICVGAMSHKLKTGACNLTSLSFQQSASSETTERF